MEHSELKKAVSSTALEQYKKRESWRESAEKWSGETEQVWIV